MQYEYRTGIGTDIHKLVSDRPLLLGGVQVPFELGLLGHSDGDVVLHAVIDAVLGAAALGDIGTLFPDTDPELKDVDSRQLHAQLPKLGPYKGQIKRRVAGLLETDFANVNIKAKTNEGLDAVGEGRAIACTTTVLLKRRLK
jgi:2C-methyl-D-erythritol 2,4-cyclodiphosphate synthase